nr:putative ribonuclease H-like domain-containing protein [Tanacetum cinerariifolium]
ISHPDLLLTNLPTVSRNYSPVNRKFSTGSKNFPTANRKFPTASRKFPTGSIKSITADMGLKGKAVKPSACNISYLYDFEPYDGGYVSFGQGGYKITGKWTIKTGKLEFENVYFVKDLKYNLFSVSQICNNKNSVLFTDSKCIVLGRDFKLLDDANILLRTPRQHNMRDNRGEFRNKEMNDFCSFRVFNKRTRRVEENLHVEFLENKAIEKGAGPNWLFDIDYLTKSMNYVPVDARTISTNLSGTKDATSQEMKKDVSSLRYIALPNWAYEALLEFSSRKPHNHCSTEVHEDSGNFNPTASTSNSQADQMETLTVETNIPIVSSPVPTAYSTDSQEPSSDARLISERVANQEETPFLDNILTLTNRFEDILGGTTNSDESNREEADISNIETVITASPTPTLRIHKDHPKSQIIGPVDTPIQTRNKSKEVGEQSFIATIHQKTDPALLQFCLFSCFLSQVEPKKISDALQDPSWVEAMQEELLQFKIQNVWTLVDCPKGVRPIGTKWVLKNKKDERGIVIRNKARLVAQGHTQEEGIDYDEVFAPVARIEAIRLFLAYASFMGFTVYQMDVKSAFLYGTIDEELYVMQPPGFQDPEFPAKVYKVKKAMYGLHQAPRAWYGTLSKYLLKNGFQRGTIDQTLFIRKQREDFILVQCKLFPLLGKLSTASVFLGFGLTFAGTSRYWGVLRILMINLRLIPLGEHKTDFHPMVDFLEASPLRTVPLFTAMLVHQSEGSGTPTEPHQTPSPEAQTPSHTTHPSSSLPPITTTSIPTVTPTETTPIMATIDKSSTLPHDSAPQVTSPIAVEGNMQQTIPNLTALCTSLQRQLSELTDKFQAQEVEINRLKERVKHGSIPTASTLVKGSVPTGSDEVPTASLVFATATMVTPVTRRKGKEVKDFRGMTFKEVEAKFNSVCKQIEDFIPIGSKEEAERIKRKGINLEQESKKKQKSSEEIIEEAKSPEEVPEEKVKEVMNLVPIEEEYVEALQVKHHIIDWKVHSEGQRSYWKITRLACSSACYQFFIDLLKHLDREDLNQLWRLVKETLSNRPPSSDKEMKLWLEHQVYGRIVRNKMHKAFPLPVIKFPLAEEVPTAGVKGCHCQKKSEATARKIALLC